MIDFKELTWRCDACGDERPDEKISVLSVPWVIGGRVVGQRNYKYCNDKPDCLKQVEEKARRA